jgi:hypothetical protein
MSELIMYLYFMASLSTTLMKYPFARNLIESRSLSYIEKWCISLTYNRLRHDHGIGEVDLNLHLALGEVDYWPSGDWLVLPWFKFFPRNDSEL